jgi:hypothetical protein
MNLKKSGFIIWLILFVLMLAAAASAQTDTLRLLFIGNSHTYYNNLPHLFANLAQSGGYPVVVDSNTPPGYTLEGHCSNPITLSKIAQGGWDYVILQEQSLYPVIDFYRYGSMYPAARHLDSLISSVGARTALYMTWGWRGGGQHDVNGHYSIPFVDYFQMQDTLTAAYVMLADQLSALLLPAGCAWARAMRTDTTLDLWQPDNYHPKLEGSYIAACVFYATFFHQTPLGLTYTAGLDPDSAAFFQLMAEQTVLGIEDEPGNRPITFELQQNYPNPFNSSTIIKYTLPQDSKVTLKVFDILGQEITTLENSYQHFGLNSITWDGKDKNDQAVSSGIYFYKIQAGDISQTKRLSFLK